MCPLVYLFSKEGVQDFHFCNCMSKNQGVHILSCTTDGLINALLLAHVNGWFRIANVGRVLH